MLTNTRQAVDFLSHRVELEMHRMHGPIRVNQCTITFSVTGFKSFNRNLEAAACAINVSGRMYTLTARIECPTVVDNTRWPYGQSVERKQVSPGIVGGDADSVYAEMAEFMAVVTFASILRCCNL